MTSLLHGAFANRLFKNAQPPLHRVESQIIVFNSSIFTLVEKASPYQIVRLIQINKRIDFYHIDSVDFGIKLRGGFFARSSYEGAFREPKL